MDLARALPCMLPPVRLGRRLCMDGALGSATHADALLGLDLGQVVVVSPDGPSSDLDGVDEEWLAAIRRERALLERETEVALIAPAAGDLAAMGPSFLAPGHVAESVALGRTRGAAASVALRGAIGGGLTTLGEGTH